MIPPMNIVDITEAASFNDNGPDGITVSAFWSSKKFAENQPLVDPNDAVKIFPEPMTLMLENTFRFHGKRKKKSNSYRKYTRWIAVL